MGKPDLEWCPPGHGDVYQVQPNGSYSPTGNIRGPAGPTGPAGPQGEPGEVQWTDIVPIVDVARLKGVLEDLIACRRLLDAALKDG